MPGVHKTLHLTPEAGAFFVSAISEQNFAFAMSSLASGSGALNRSAVRTMMMVQKTI